MMNGWGYGDNFFIGGILMMIFWVAIVVGIVILIVWLTRQSTGHTHQAGPVQGPYPGPGAEHHETAIDILNARYARGEIDKAEYEQKKKDLSG
ncbi:MAG: SHOCT domain-containing protein [Actinobacteria bacterium]|nr:SHOCT domain-containing protein [Actinomycetota bacterium]